MPEAASGPWLKPRPGSGEKGSAPRSTQKKVSKIAPNPGAGTPTVFVMVVVRLRNGSLPAAVYSVTMLSAGLLSVPVTVIVAEVAVVDPLVDA
jgi:hypothetical protein